MHCCRLCIGIGCNFFIVHTFTEHSNIDTLIKYSYIINTWGPQLNMTTFTTKLWYPAFSHNLYMGKYAVSFCCKTCHKICYVVEQLVWSLILHIRIKQHFCRIFYDIFFTLGCFVLHRWFLFYLIRLLTYRLYLRSEVVTFS